MKCLENPFLVMRDLVKHNEGAVVVFTNLLLDEYFADDHDVSIRRFPIKSSYVPGEDDDGVDTDDNFRLLISDCFDLKKTKTDAVVDVVFEVEYRQQLVPSTNEQSFDITAFMDAAVRGQRHLIDYMSKTTTRDLPPQSIIMQDRNYIIPLRVISGAWPKLSAGVFVEYKNDVDTTLLNAQIKDTLKDAGAGAAAMNVKESRQEFSSGEHLKIKLILSISNLNSERIKPVLVKV